ncbi:type VI secretion system lipoprotein TssJ [Pseudomonas simiae]|uniref:type VI secretion system lipoprotein TssJ n=1 Tax=Pseudomonas simiae TaxID=321846 RepID=UPI0018E3A0A5|nr:type VI secretion system lipoprotein TssJ [Pseudomonas simiae]
MARLELLTRWWLASGLLACMSGCNLFADPAPEPPADPHLTLTLQASLDTNRNLYGRPSPVRVQVFQLLDRRTFEQASLAQLSTAAEQTLRGDWLGQEMIVLRPGERYRYHFIPEPRMRYIGVIAEYRDIDQARWRVITLLDQRKTPVLSVLIGRHAIEFMAPSMIELQTND